MGNRPYRNLLILQHVSWEGPGIIARVLKERGVQAKVVRLYRGETIPFAEVEGLRFDALVGLGSPSTAYDPSTNPNHYDEVELHRRARRMRLPSFNICYSMQLFCMANGGTVARNPRGKEVGFEDVALTRSGRRDGVFGPVGDHRMLQWHGDVVLRLPPGALRLGSSEKTLNQLAVVDGVHYLVQGDGQAATPSMVSRWFEKDGKWATEGTGIERDRVVGEAERGEREHEETYSKIFGNFLDLAMRRPG